MAGSTEDCYAALLDLVARREELDLDPTRVAVMGDSAGGTLAAVVALLARDRSGRPWRTRGCCTPPQT